jgi:hypothetical protein
MQGWSVYPFPLIHLLISYLSAHYFSHSLFLFLGYAGRGHLLGLWYDFSFDCCASSEIHYCTSENCSPPSNASGYIIANNIRLIAQAYGSIKSFKAYLEITDQVSSARTSTLRSEFQSSGVSLIDCPHNNRKEVADKMIIGKQFVIVA